MMKLYAPEYYRDFTCIADRCRHSCCIGWEIDIDSNTYERYSALSSPYGKTIMESIDTGTESPFFKLAANDRCPHLSENGLCKIILSEGENLLCNICREHPRFYSDTARGKEVGLGMSCEEAARIILSSDGYLSITEIGEVDGDICSEYDGIHAREKAYSILSDISVPYSDRLSRLYRELGISLDTADDEVWKDLLGELEYLDETHRELFSASYSSDISTPAEAEEALERALAYFIYRHVSGAEDENDLRMALGFSFFCERLLASLIKSYPQTDITEHARLLSEELEYSSDNTEAIKLEFLFC
ncbi:MAG: flagellin lysine-N-methylase [Clostridia bacterium]|nr:flagellin lysine-N-methylase [Clostridia bacterium]